MNIGHTRKYLWYFQGHITSQAPCRKCTLNKNKEMRLASLHRLLMLHHPGITSITIQINDCWAPPSRSRDAFLVTNSLGVSCIQRNE